MKKMLQHSPTNVPQPLPMIEEKAKARLSTDGLISWKIMLKEWEKVSAKDKKVVSSLLTLNSFDLIETMDITGKLLEEYFAYKAILEFENKYGKMNLKYNEYYSDYSDYSYYSGSSDFGMGSKSRF